MLTVEAACFRCARAVVRPELWDPRRSVSPRDLPTPGDLLTDLSGEWVGGRACDDAWPERAKASLR